MAFVLSSISGNLISAASAGFAPTNSADVSAIASAYQVVSATGTKLYNGTYYLTSVNDNQLSAKYAVSASSASAAFYARYDRRGGVVRSLSSLPGSAEVSAIASAYAESAASSKQDELTFSYDENDRIDGINGSALAGQGGGELVTSIQSALDPWYQTSISGLNGSSLYPKWAESAKSAQNAYTADFAAHATSAGAAPTAWASSLITGVTSPSGTIRVIGGTSLEGTNSAILPSTIIEGFSTSFDGNTLGPSVKLHCVFPTANPSTEIIMPFYYGSGRILLSSDNGGIENSWEKDHSPETITAQVPNATAVDIWVDNSWIPVNTVTASAATQELGGGVAELAWASALPTYSYDAEDKISAINGSAIAGGGAAGIDSATCSAIASAYAESAASSKQDALTFGYDTANAISSIDGSALAGGGGGEADWSAESGQPGYIENKPVPKTLVAGQGITITENSTGLVVASTNTLYTAGSGLTLNGTTFAVDTATVQGKLTYDYDASGNISGIDGSALVGGDPEAADLYVKSPLYTGVSGGSAYIGWNNETVLYSNYTGRPTNTGSTISLNESPMNFQYVEVYLNGLSATSTSAGWANSYQKIDTVTLSSVPGLTFVGLLSGNSTWWDVGCAYTGVSSTTWTKTLGYTKQVNSTAAGMLDNVNHLNIWKVVGINRTAGE